MFAPVGWKRDSVGAEDLADLTLDMGSRGDALSVLLDCGLLQAVEIADQIVPFDADLVGLAALGEFFLYHQGEERAEDMAADQLRARPGALGKLCRSELHPPPVHQAQGGQLGPAHKAMPAGERLAVLAAIMAVEAEEP